MHIRNRFDELGKKLNITFIAIKPPKRCKHYNNRWCWSHDTDEEVSDTYAYILEPLGNRKIAGIIGFSNGGFFLNRLAQTRSLPFPLISMGAAGYLADASHPNKLFLIVGKRDIHHYDDALKFYKASLESPLQITFIEHAQGHIVPFDILENLLQKDKNEV